MTDITKAQAEAIVKADGMAAYTKAFNLLLKEMLNQLSEDEKSELDAMRKADGPTTSDVHVDGLLGSTPKPKPPEGTPVMRLIKSDAPQRVTLGIVYAPMVEDSQGDFASAAEIEQACWAFNLKLQHQDAVTKAAITVYDQLTKAAAGEPVEIMLPTTPIEKGLLGIQHSVWDDSFGDIIESYIAPCDMVLDDQPITKGTWLMSVRWSEAIFAKILDGSLTGYSFGGSAFKTKVAAVA